MIRPSIMPVEEPMTGKRRGRPPINDTALGRRTVYLTQDELRLVERLGDGNISAGIRRALGHLAEYDQWCREHFGVRPVWGPSPRSKHQ